MKALSLIFLLFILVIIALADIGGLPPAIRALYRFPNGDKVGHFILFGLLNFFLTHALLSSRLNQPRGWVTVSMALILASFIAIEEWSQQFFSTRTVDLLDLLASYTGVIVGGGVAYRMKNGR